MVTRWRFLLVGGVLALLAGGVVCRCGAEDRPDGGRLKLEVLEGLPAPADAAAETPEAKIRRVLAARVRVEAADVPLGEFCREVAKRFGINVVMDVDNLGEYDVGADTPVTISRGDLRLSAVLDRVLRPLDATWMLRDEVLMITTEMGAEENLTVEVYDVADLVTADSQGDRAFDFDPLVSVILQTIEPDSWVDMGGNCELESFEANGLQVLVVAQTRLVHERVSKLLADLRVHAAATPGGASGQPKRPAETSAAGEGRPKNVEGASPDDPVRRALRRRIDMRLQEETFAEFVGRLKKLLGIDIQLDTESLEEYDVLPDTSVSLDVKGISARAVLSLVGRQLDFTWVIEEGALSITSPERAYERLAAKVYDVADLVEVPGDDGPVVDFEPLIQVICHIVLPDSWVDAGGNAPIESLQNDRLRVLVISQTQYGHEKIEKLLAQLRKVRREGRGKPLPKRRPRSAGLRARQEKHPRVEARDDVSRRPRSRELKPIERNPDRDILVRGGNQFAFDLYRKLRAGREGQNVFFSPMSLSTAMAMAHAGARGRTAEVMSETMHFTLEPARLYPASAALLAGLTDGPYHKLTVANRLWVQRGQPLLAPFLETTRDYYGAESALLDFAGQPDAAVNRINDWASRETHGRIRQLLTHESISGDERLVLTNAVHFKAPWSLQFPNTATMWRSFHTARGRKRVPLMANQDDVCRYAEIDEPAMQILEKDYLGNELSMVILLPANEPGALEELESRLTAENVAGWMQRMQPLPVKVMLPRFRLETSYQLAEPLRSLGMKSAFAPGADFSGVDGQGSGLFLSQIVHKALVEVDEQGTEAAAATGGGYFGGPLEFRADRPFVFLIRDQRTDCILFLGRLSDPVQFTVSGSGYPM